MNQRTLTSRCHRPGLNPRQASAFPVEEPIRGVLMALAISYQFPLREN